MSHSERTELLLGWRRQLALLAVATASLGIPISSASAGSSISALDYAQCANGSPGTSGPCTWINGILNANNSQFHENEVTPQRLLVSSRAPAFTASPSGT